MALLKPIHKRDQTLTMPVSKELHERLDGVRKRCNEQGMILPLDELVEDFLNGVLKTAEAELNGERMRRGGRAKKSDEADEAKPNGRLSASAGT